MADALGEKQPSLSAVMHASREDVLASMDCATEHARQIAGTKCFERLHEKVKRRADGVGIFARTRPSSAAPAPTGGQRRAGRRSLHMSLEAIARVSHADTVGRFAVVA